MRRLLVASVVALTVPALVLGGWIATRSDDQPELGTLLDRVVTAGAPGAFVVVREDGAMHSEARGFADAGRSVAMRTDQRFRIGSVTKTFLAALVLRLVEDGKLRLGDPVERWLPGLVPRAREITVHHLLSHTSGLSDYVADPRVLGDPGRKWRPAELVALALANPDLPSEPTGRFAYSSTNYIVLGLLAEEVGRAPLGSQLRDRIFEPLGLGRTSFVPGLVTGDHIHGHRSPSHQGVVTGPPVDTSDEPGWWAWGAGGIVSTAGDLQRFFSELLRGRLLGATSLRELKTLVPAGRQRYGLGIATFPTPCGPAWGHTGNVGGTVAVAWNTHDASRQVVLVVNTYPLSGDLEEAVRRLQHAAFCGP
jgi:D-alanyl-D-alanine carboxypeptidase